MGLNATLKCGVLGGKGKALNVIAQELRGYANKTVVDSRIIMEALTDIDSAARAMTNASTTDGTTEVGDLLRSMNQSMNVLEAEGQKTEGVLAALGESVESTIALLHEAAAKIGVYTKICALLRDGARGFKALAAMEGPAGGESNEVKAAVTASAKPLYTLDRERDIHRAVIGESA
jgi:hypothetical protein